MPDAPLAELLADARHRAPDPPSLDEVIEDAGRQRLGAYYLYSALLAGVIGPGDLAPGRWPHELAEPVQRLNLTRFAPRTGRGLDAQLTLAEQAIWRSQDRQGKFAQLVLDLINKGAFGPPCGDADSVRLARAADGRGLDLELLQGQRVVGTCAVKDHWELVAQHLAGLPLHGRLAEAASMPGAAQKAAHQLQETGISHAVSAGVTLAVSVHPLGAAAGLGTRLVRSRIQAGRDEADALHGLGEELRTLRAGADRKLGDLLGGAAPRHRRVHQEHPAQAEARDQYRPCERTRLGRHPARGNVKRQRPGCRPAPARRGPAPASRLEPGPSRANQTSAWTARYPARPVSGGGVDWPRGRLGRVDGGDRTVRSGDRYCCHGHGGCDRDCRHSRARTTRAALTAVER